MKFLAILPAVALLSAPAFAAPYVNVEANSGFTGSDYTGTSTDFHVGVDGSEGAASVPSTHLTLPTIYPL